LALLRGELAFPGPPAKPSTTPTAPEPHVARAPAAWRRALTTLVGREGDLQQIEDELASEPLVTLVAVGGAGKTRLALELARRAGARGEDVHAVELAGLRDPDEVLPALLSALGASESTSDAERPQVRRMLTPEDRLRRAVADLHGLLVLDNCEQVLDGAATAVAGLLAVAPGDLQVLATRRSALGVAGETVHPVLALPDDVAVRLLETRARAGRPTLGWDPQTALELCRRLDHLPLAIELAAARLRTMPLDDVLAGVVDRFGLLDDALRGLPDQHAGLWAMVDWSWTLLAVDDRVLLANLSVFPAPFTAAAAEAVAVDPATRGSDVRRGLAALVEHSLLTLEDAGLQTGGARYRMLETVREYGAARLGTGAGRSAVMLRLARWAASTANGHARQLSGAEQLDALAGLTADQESLVEALRWATAERHEREAFAIGAALLFAWSVRGLHAEAQTWARLVLQGDSATRGTSAAVRARPATTAQLGVGGVPEPDDVATVALFAVLSGGIGDDLRTLVLGRRTAVRVLAEDSDRLSAGVRSLLLALHVTLEAAVTLDISALLPATAALVEDPDPRLRGLGHLLRSGAHENLGDVARSLEDARAAFDQFELTGNRWGMAIAARGLGLWESGPGGTDPDRWLIVAQENFELVGAAQDARSIAVARVVNAAVRGDLDARPALEEVVISGAHDVSTRAQALSGLAALDAVSGRWDEAIVRADQAVALASESGSGAPQARVIYQGAAALMRIRSGRPDAVREGSLLLARALPDALATRDVPVMSAVALGYAELAAYLGEAERAREIWSLAMRLGSHTAMVLGTPDGALAAALGDDASRVALRAQADALTSAEAPARGTTLG
ncbi:MAG: transcriptional regulator, partial [Cellulomonas sp.]|uniref:ATP-binding protein n=1 Tax=Cellulomonas sp. TaxID=40001 RepID=UPI00178E1F86